jgi:uncharacterized membrane protein YeiH
MNDVVYGLDLFGVAVFAVSGSLAAGRKRMDIFGMLVLALVTALGGGTLRDMILPDTTVFWVDDLYYLLVVLLASMGTFVAVRLMNVPPRRWFFLFDALGLAVFTVIGASKALDVTDSGTLAVVMGVMTGVVGGMMRDVLSAEVPLVLRKEIYAIASLCGAIVYVVMDVAGAASAASITLSIITTLAIRLAAIRWGLSLPVFASRQNDGNGNEG